MIILVLFAWCSWTRRRFLNLIVGTSFIVAVFEIGIKIILLVLFAGLLSMIDNGWWFNRVYLILFDIIFQFVSIWLFICCKPIIRVNWLTMLIKLSQKVSVFWWWVIFWLEIELYVILKIIGYLNRKYGCLRWR